jgi:hypothetical protein
MLAFSLSAQENATIRDMEGKVMLQEAGQDWEPAAVGATVRMGTTISTGFKATALLDLGTSEIVVKPLTSLTLEDLTRSEGTVTTKLDLKVGRVNATVKTGETLTHDFELRSSFSTAAVRGTEFDYDGERIDALAGTILYYNLINQKRTLVAGNKSSTTGYQTPELAELEDIALALIFSGSPLLTKTPPLDLVPETPTEVPVTVSLE